MSRKEKPAIEEQNIKTGALAQASTDVITVASNATEVADLLQYDMPYNLERVVQETTFYLRTASVSMMEAGKRLLLIKELEPHGKLLEVFASVGLKPRMAQMMMQAAEKFLTNPALAQNAQAFAHLDKTKIFALLEVDDDSLNTLAEGGSVLDKNLQDIDRMTTRELKNTVLALRADTSDKDGVIAAKDERIGKLGKQIDEASAKAKKIKPEQPDEASKTLILETEAIVYDAGIHISHNVGAAFEALNIFSNERDESYLAAHRQVMLKALETLKLAIADLENEYELTGDPDDIPWIKTEAAAAH
jgi:hypothetical protein